MPLHDDEPLPTSDSYIHIRWSWVAALSTILMLLSLGALILVATLQKVDALATIALALAVLSFVIQIGLFVADTWQRSQSEARANQVNVESKSLLAEMKETSRATNELLNRQFDTVLKSLIDATEKTVGGSKGLDSDLRDRLDRELRAVIAGSPPRSRNLSNADRAVLSDLARPLTPEETVQAKEIIDNLPGPAISGLLELGKDDENARGDFGTPGLFESLFKGADDLLAAELIQQTDVPPSFAAEERYEGKRYFVLTDKGRIATRYLRGPSRRMRPSGDTLEG